MIENKQLLTVKQFAEALGITEACVRRWILERKIAVIKLGRLIRITPEERDRLVEMGHRPARGQR
jgi:excisionase family DNA binding protein